MIGLLEGKYFKTFIAVLEEENFSRAANKLDYVQSTVSAHVQMLEQACQQKLFHRFPKGVKPTDAGLKLSKFAYQYIQLGISIEESMNGLEQPSGMVQMCLPESFYLTRMLPLVKNFLIEYPKVKVKVEAGFQPEVLNRVLDHAVDFGIVPRNPNRKDVIFYPLVEEELIVIASNKLAETIKRTGLTALNNELMISFGSSCIYHTVASKLLEETGIKEYQLLEFPSIEMIIQSVMCGIGFALIPKIAVEKELQEQLLSRVIVASPIVTTHGLIVHKERELSFSAKQFKSQIIAEFSYNGIK